MNESKLAAMLSSSDSYSFDYVTTNCGIFRGSDHLDNWWMRCSQEHCTIGFPFISVHQTCVSGIFRPFILFLELFDCMFPLESHLGDRSVNGSWVHFGDESYGSSQRHSQQSYLQRIFSKQVRFLLMNHQLIELCPSMHWAHIGAQITVTVFVLLSVVICSW